MYCYKIIDADGKFVGLGSGENPMTKEEMRDELHGHTYVEITEAEYLEFCE